MWWSWAGAAIGLCARSAPRHLAAYLALTVCVAVVPVALAWLTKLTLDLLVNADRSPSSLNEILTTAIGLAVTGLAVAVVPQVTQYVRAEIDRRVGLRSQDELFAAVERFVGLARFEDPVTLDSLRLAQQSSSSPVAAVDAVLGVLRGVLAVAGFIGSVLLVSPVVTASIVVAAGVALPFELRLSRRRAAMMWQIGPAERREMFYADLLSRVDAAKEVRLFGLGVFLRSRMSAERQASDAARRQVDRRELAVQGTLAALSATVFGVGLVVTILSAARGRLTVGDVSLFIAAVAGVQGALGALVTSIAATHQQLLMFGHYVHILRAGPDLPTPANPVAAPALRYGIQFHDVWFRYSDEHPWILRGISLFIPYGRAVALVGRNGAGKSTIIKLLCRFYDPTYGAITWDGIDIRHMATDQLRARIGVVFQDYMCYDLTAEDNIVVGDLHARHQPDRIQTAAWQADIHQTIEGLPRGYQTMLTRMFAAEPDIGVESSRVGMDDVGPASSDGDSSPTGVVLSGGQWQRLALARAFLRSNRDLMILDEPSAGMDPEAEHDLHNKLRAMRQGSTSLLVSHRLGTIRDADHIIVLADGIIIEQGTHDQLLDLGGMYARLFMLQASGYKAETAERLLPASPKPIDQS
ncbi:MAG TPA: ABC transporter ATP-binding protein [Micromonosporaceae bacterium]|nr:ABC transporter ATP-binding protein [Micromonosporaceae bacterium]